MRPRLSLRLPTPTPKPLLTRGVITLTAHAYRTILPPFTAQQNYAPSGAVMSTNVVNLDALIPRDDFAVSETPTKATPLDRINIAHLDGHFFAGDLRKPDFQRETAQWTPAKVVDLIRSFLDADLIPGIILWRAGTSIFVIDGAHRLSAMLAWILDDYGDRKKSLDHSGGYITEEQRRVAERTRDLVAKSVNHTLSTKHFAAIARRHPLKCKRDLATSRTIRSSLSG